jgi:hypothetical protein
MDTYTIDVELEHYYGDRMATSNREACRRLYLRAVSKFSGADLEKYLARVKAHARVYASLSHALRSPLPHVETPLFLSSFVLFIGSIVMIAKGETSIFVAGGFSASIVGMVNCARKLSEYWQSYAVREAVFRELVEELVREKSR